MTVNQRINFIIEQKGLNKNSFSVAIGIQPQTLHHIVGGRLTKPSFEVLQKIISTYSDINPSWLITGKGDFLLSPTLSPILSPNQNLGPKDQVQIYGSSKLPPLTVTLDATGKENIVLVDVKAAAGYPQGYLEPSFFKKLPVFSLPGANFHNGTFRAFEVEGDSMFNTLFHGDWVVCRYCTSIDEIREGYIHVVVTATEVVVKRILNRIGKYGKLILKSDNANYPPRELQSQDVQEVWLVKSFIGFNMPNRNLDVVKRLGSLETEVLDINTRLKAIESGKKHN